MFPEKTEIRIIMGPRLPTARKVQSPPAGDEPGIMKTLHQAEDAVQFRRGNGAFLQPFLTPFVGPGRVDMQHAKREQRDFR